MRFIRVPEPVEFEYAEGKSKMISLSELIRKTLIVDPRVTQDDASIDKFMEIKDGCQDMKPGDIWALESDTWEFLSLLIRTFPNYSPEAKLVMFPLFKSVTGAKTKNPNEPKTDEPPAAAAE